MAAEHGDPVTLEVAGHEVTVSSPDKVMFPAAGVTKLGLAEYYVAVGDALLTAMADRPVMLERYPDGVGGGSFFQKRIPKNAPDWLQTTMVATINGTPSEVLVVADVAHVLWAVNLGCLGLHVWPACSADPDQSDELRLDLDPSPGCSFDMVREAADATRVFLDEHGIGSFAKTSGSKGIHVHVPLEEGWDGIAVRAAAVTIARRLADRHPELVTAKWWKEERGRRIFLDYNQNAPHKTMFGAWCARPRVGAQVSTPFRWEELATIDPEAWTVATVPDRLAAEGDPWAGIAQHPQDISGFVEEFVSSLADGVPDAPWPPQYPKMPHEPRRVAPSRARKEP